MRARRRPFESIRLVATFALLHGAWHDQSCWDELIPELRERGHEAVAPELPLDDPDATFDDRARPAIEALAGVTDAVVVVGHSMSSAYAPLVANERAETLLVHLCPSLAPFPPPPGAPDRFRAELPFPPARDVGITVWDPDVALSSIYARLPAETARDLAGRLRPMAPPPDAFPLAGHPDVPTALIYAADDEFFNPDWERLMAREVLGVDPIEIPGGHFPMVENPARLAGLLASLVTDNG
jgi:pimeloyl-ACP methyl ester carboxylesterase